MLQSSLLYIWYGFGETRLIRWLFFHEDVMTWKYLPNYWPFVWETHRPSADSAHERPGMQHFNTLRPRQNGRHFADDIFKYIFLNENVWIPIKISPKFAPKGRINNIPALVQIMAWRRPGDKPLSEPMMVSLPTHICVTRPQWVNLNSIFYTNKLLSSGVAMDLRRPDAHVTSL